jgi:hypothetical protein
MGKASSILLYIELTKIVRYGTRFLVGASLVLALYLYELIVSHHRNELQECEGWEGVAWIR